jgi:hypothetical protein
MENKSVSIVWQSPLNNAQWVSKVTMFKKAATDHVNVSNLNKQMIDCLLFNIQR